MFAAPKNLLKYLLKIAAEFGVDISDGENKKLSLW
jgi:hypothetical protein